MRGGTRWRRIESFWSCDTRVDVLSDELLREMRLAGCERLSLGVESGSPKILAQIDKKITVENRGTEYSGGRRSKTFSLNGKLGLVSGIDIGATSIDLCVADFSGKSLARYAEPAVVKDGPIKVLGQDFNGYGARLRAAAGLLGFDPARIEVLIYQLVSVVEHGEAKRMSKRRGDVVFLTELLDRIGETLVATAITNDEAFRRRLLDCTRIDRLNLGPIPTIQLNWLQPHEGNLVDFLFRARALQVA